MQTTQQPKIVAAVPTNPDASNPQAQHQGVLVAYLDTANLPTYAVCLLSSVVVLIVSNEILPAIWSNPNAFVSFIFNIVRLFGAIATFFVANAIISIGMTLWTFIRLLQRGVHKLEKRREDQNWNKSRTRQI